MLKRLQDLMHGLKRRIVDAYWERRFGVSTETPAPSVDPDSRVYATLPYDAIFHILHRLHITSSDVLVEIGCGKGRVLLAAMQFPLREVVGVELSSELASEGRRNVAKQARATPRVEVLTLPAQEFDFRRGTLFYFFNPFGADTLRSVLSAMERGLREAPRPIRIVYVRPLHEDVLKQFAWLEKVDEYEALSFAATRIPVGFWRSV
jgi:precorrin-6B methylase 2